MRRSSRLPPGPARVPAHTHELAGAHALAAAGRLGRALTATVVVIAALVAAVVVAGALAPVSAAAVSGPESWKCDSKRLGLEKVVVARAPVQASERFSTGRGISSRPDARDKWVPVILVHGWVSRATHPDSDGTDATRGAFWADQPLAQRVQSSGWQAHVSWPTAGHPRRRGVHL